MKIIRAYIENFGKLNDFSVEFKSGLNVINENNGFGKSTLCAFIKTMFYGFPITKTKNIDENERIKFTPWQGGKFGGYLDFAVDGREYRIIREFGARASLDKFTLFNLSLGEESTDYSEKIGEELFGIDLSGFEKCTYFSNIDLNKDIPNSILARIFDNTENLNSYENACKTLIKRGRQYKTVGNKGIIGDTTKKLSDFQNKRFETENLINSFSDKKKEIEELSKRKSELISELEEIREKIRYNAHRSIIREKISYYNSLVDKTEKLKEKISTVSNKYKNGVPDESYISEVVQKIDNLSDLAQNRGKGKLPLYLLFGAVSLILAVVGVLFDFYSIITLPLFSVIAVVLFALFFTFKGKQNKAKNSEKAVFDELNKIYPNNFNSSAEAKNCIEIIKNDLSELKSLQREFDEYTARAKEYKNTEKLTSLEYKDFTADEEVGKETEAKLNKEIDDISMKILTLNSSLENLPSLEDNLLELNLNIEKAEKELEISESNYEIIKKAYEFLEKANSNLALKYKDKVKANFVNYLSIFLDSDDALLSNKLEVMINEAGEFRDVKSFSSGKKAVIEFSLRLAVSYAVFEKAIPFFILDDTFSCLDDKTFNLISGKIRELSSDMQIIYFTCTKNRAL